MNLLITGEFNSVDELDEVIEAMVFPGEIKNVILLVSDKGYGDLSDRYHRMGVGVLSVNYLASGPSIYEVERKALNAALFALGADYAVVFDGASAEQLIAGRSELKHDGPGVRVYQLNK